MIVKMEEWREYFAGEIETRYGVDPGDARKRAEELIESLFGEDYDSVKDRNAGLADASATRVH
jgi:hypothetical protein